LSFDKVEYSQDGTTVLAAVKINQD
jgi:hypothetical protein